jgi:hypothetical protein
MRPRGLSTRTRSAALGTHTHIHTHTHTRNLQGDQGSEVQRQQLAVKGQGFVEQGVERVGDDARAPTMATAQRHHVGVARAVVVLRWNPTALRRGAFRSYITYMLSVVGHTQRTGRREWVGARREGAHSAGSH